MDALRLKLSTVCLAMILISNEIYAHKLVPQKSSEETNQVDSGNLSFKSAPPEEMSVPIGARMELECEASGPTPTIHWLFNGVRVVQSANGIEEDEGQYGNAARTRMVLNIGSTKSKLIIDCVTPDMQGEYTCVADIPKNRIATSTQVRVEYKTATNEMNTPCLTKRQGVSSPAQIYMWTAQRLEVEGADVQLFCRATGYPQPSITWQDSAGNTLNGESDQYDLLPNGDLMIRGIQFIQNMGIYTCVAHNSFGEDMQGAFLYPTSL